MMKCVYFCDDNPERFTKLPFFRSALNITDSVEKLDWDIYVVFPEDGKLKIQQFSTDSNEWLSSGLFTAKKFEGETKVFLDVSWREKNGEDQEKYRDKIAEMAMQSSNCEIIVYSTYGRKGADAYRDQLQDRLEKESGCAGCAVASMAFPLYDFPQIRAMESIRDMLRVILV